MARRSARFWLITASIGIHVAAGIGVFASGVWHLERLESDYKMAGIAMMMPPPAPAGSPAAMPAQKLEKKRSERKIAKDPVQPVTRPDPEVAPATAAVATTTGTGNGLGDGTGDGDNPDGADTDTGTCTGPACGPPAAPQLPAPVVAPPAPRTIPPTVLQSLRIAGETQIHPSDVTKTQMLRDGHERTVGLLKVCVSTRGAVSSVAVLSSTKYPAFDQQLVRAVRGWRYRPHTVDGAPVPVCGAVSFVYTMR